MPILNPMRAPRAVDTARAWRAYDSPAAAAMMPRRNLHLDALRFVAALLVLLSHLRAFVFADYATLEKPSILLRWFYFMTGLGHEAVVIFFVLSGYFVSRTICRPATGDWSALGYAVNRLSRLWTVLIPGLLATLLWDSWGQHLSHSPYYQGMLGSFYHSGPPPPMVPLDLQTFLGNLAFLQTILVPTYGDNVPLWSLANEFWYYVLFPLLYIGLVGGSSWQRRIGAIGAAIIMLWLLPAVITDVFGIWLLGYVIAEIEPRLRWSRATAARLATPIAALAVVTALVLARSHWFDQLLTDYLLGLAVAALLLCLLQSSVCASKSVIGRLMELGAETSYSLYIFHFPLLSFIACVMLDNQTHAPDLRSAILFAAIFGTALTYSALAYLLFERNTFQVRRGMLEMVSKLRGVRI